MDDPLNTHSYDGRIDVGQLVDLVEVSRLSLDCKKEKGRELIDAMKSRIHPGPLAYLINIVACMGSPANIDHTNHLVADDLICLCWVYRENPEFISVLEIQLLDMITGFCPQGRTHRLFQTLLAFL